MTQKDKTKKTWFSIAIIGLVLVVIACIVILGIFVFPKNNIATNNKQTNPIFAEIALKNLAVGMRTYSAMNGGGGNTGFTSDISKIKQYVSQDIFKALQGYNQIPYNGFVIELSEYPVGDSFQSNFRFIASPANGFIGQSYQIDKFEQIQPFNP